MPAQSATVAVDRDHHVAYLLRLGDSPLILGHRLSEWCAKAPILEEEMALTNMGLDLIGQARALLAHAAAIRGTGTEDTLAYLRPEQDYTNLLLVEQPNGDFAVTMARQLFYAVFAEQQWRALANSTDTVLAGIAAKAEKEAVYHVRHAAEWIIRLGDGTTESHRRMQDAVDALWDYTGEMFACDGLEQDMAAAGIGADPSRFKAAWDETVDSVLAEATLTRPADGWMQAGGRHGRHTEHLGHILSEMQYLQRAYPGAQW